MYTSLDQYGSRNEVNKCIASNLINVIQLERGSDSFEQKCCFCFSKAYQICRDMIENSPVSIYHIPDYFHEASYLYTSDEELVTVMKAVTMSIVHTLASHFDKEWRQANDEFLNTIYSRLWKLSLPSDNKRRTGLNKMTERIDFFMGKLNGCVEIFNTVKGGTQYIDFVIPFEEIDPKKKEESDKAKSGKIIEPSALSGTNDKLIVELQAKNDKLTNEVKISADENEKLKQDLEHEREMNEILQKQVDRYEADPVAQIDLLPEKQLEIDERIIFFTSLLDCNLGDNIVQTKFAELISKMSCDDPGAIRTRISRMNSEIKNVADKKQEKFKDDTIKAAKDVYNLINLAVKGNTRMTKPYLCREAMERINKTFNLKINNVGLEEKS